MWKFSSKTLLCSVYFIIFSVISKILFLNIYDVSGYVVDEFFHLPQGLDYCHLNFTRWDPKITTLPGLYLISTLLMAPAGYCTVYGLRLTNLLAAFVNVLLFIALFHLEHDGRKTLSWPAIISGINLGILPPLYFFSHFYYTDTVSVTSVLLMILLDKKGYYKTASLTGICSVLMRQTNIIWVTMLFGEKFLNMCINITSERTRQTKLFDSKSDFWVLYKCLQNFFKKGCDFTKITTINLISVSSYLFVMIAFIVFVMINGSIVVGDKSAHEAVIHIPQLFYFSLFCVIFALPHFVLEILPFIKYVFKNKLLTIGLILIFLNIVHFNTLIHPYLLADNRHYTFYVWTRIYVKYSMSRYVLTGLYLFGIYAALKRVDAIKNFGFVLVYTPCITAVLILQKLLDVRYFLTPYVLLRLKFKTKNIIILGLEFIMYLIINYLTFQIYFTKEIYWDDLTDIQRIIW